MILAIESSCDDSSVAIMKASDFSLIHYEKISQEKEHAKYGGVVPELAARLHTAALPKVILRAKEHFKALKAIAVTNEPGLSVSLLPGIVAAKALATALNLPLISVNHLVGHIYSLFLEGPIKLPLGVLLVSGGHTMILGISKTGVISVLGATSDDSFGESFDKSAKMLGLGYPGGPQIQNLALKGDDRAYDFSLPLKGTKRLEYSFSGLKNQVRLACLELENSRIPYSVIPRLDRGISSENSRISYSVIPRLDRGISSENSKIPYCVIPQLDWGISSENSRIPSENSRIPSQQKANIAASFERVACLHIIDRLKLAFSSQKWARFGVVGGASANLRLRGMLENLCASYDCELLFAPLEYCSDNAVMIARAAVAKYHNKDFCQNLEMHPRSSLENLKII
ncbi:tRNA (adenosine(37)-N6)-threonylcarbamoyltransferase complex transferase subunit TsaD [Campylobacter sp.]|uniref:tRNA (adenosine(37)-N6)-threonylcarbamoyltransferase complex transferase subunit TsaD n=1 Tax=Campylobacter sp. TaxID=205 RepID=UPI002A57CCAB|nr:tRNA (adenosine(37)-N6)-threonylcarbamoyltransferase complex transferase subunit TsaD [Campylobacter sp.]MDD7090455.1 tRNA (adenosine(37)-N6)-threonylcarbamoyltransferase complex transferase subunit TsaD [Campylobacteraceae bacterium]MDY5284732.1 tRNA (adenosine(37)-N6)-threonylcarbamoyltransferase complex transferase subunit TsaD [Campylobacter sp.]